MDSRGSLVKEGFDEDDDRCDTPEGTLLGDINFVSTRYGTERKVHPEENLSDICF